MFQWSFSDFDANNWSIESQKNNNLTAIKQNYSHSFAEDKYM